MSDLINDYWTAKPPIEGRPTIQFDWENQYSLQRKDRMQDAIDDYLQDDKISARQAYEEMLTCVEDVIKYHDKELSKASELYNLMLGHRECDLLECADSFASAE